MFRQDPINFTKPIFGVYYDANGQVMATYNITLSTSDNIATLDEQHIYGAARLGMRKPNILLYDNAPISYAPSDVTQNTLGETYFEISNYLGNVNAVITDRKTYTTGGTSSFLAVVVSTADYYPFGMEMPNPDRIIGDAYRFGYNGMEIDNEVSGNGNSYTTEFRQYDPRLGRWKSLDPLMAQFPWMSPYVAFDNNPIFFIDPLGLSAEKGGDNPKDFDKGGTNECEDGLGDPPKKGETTLPGQQTSNGKFNGYLELPEITVSPANEATHNSIRTAMKEGKLDERKFLEMYKKYWEFSGADPNVVKEDFSGQYQQAADQANQRKEENMVYTYVAVGGIMAIATGGVAPFAGTSALASGTINSGVNLGAQLYANNGDWSKVDVLSTGIAFGSEFIPGSTALHVVRNSLIAGGVDAVFDLNIDGDFRTIVGENRKNMGLIGSDFVFGTLGNAGGLSFGKNPLLYETIGTGISVFPTTLGNKVVNDQIGN